MMRQVIHTIALGDAKRFRVEHEYVDVGASRSRRTSVGARPARGGGEDFLAARPAVRYFEGSSRPEHWIGEFDTAPPVSFALLDEQGIAVQVFHAKTLRGRKAMRTTARRVALELVHRYRLIDLVGLDKNGKVIESVRILDDQEQAA